MKPIAHFRTPVILAVDDRPDDLTLIRIAIEGQDLQVELQTALGGKAALDAVNSSPPDLILLDINMPDISGLEVLEKIRAGDNPSIPVVMFTTSDAKQDVASAFSHHANAYIRKPDDFDQLEETLSGVVKHWFEDVILPSGEP